MGASPSLIRLSDTLLPVACTVRTLSSFSACHIKPESRAASAWLSGIACAGVLVSFLRVLLALCYGLRFRAALSFCALLSQEDTTLQHLRSPRSTGCLLRGGLTLTTTGLSPASRRQLSGHTSGRLGGLPQCVRPALKTTPDCDATVQLQVSV